MCQAVWIFLEISWKYTRRLGLTNVPAVKTITGDDSLSGLDGAFQKYNEEQLTTIKLPGASQTVRNILWSLAR
jgi:hypothetical protein